MERVLRRWRDLEDDAPLRVGHFRTTSGHHRRPPTTRRKFSELQGALTVDQSSFFPILDVFEMGGGFESLCCLMSMTTFKYGLFLSGDGLPRVEQPFFYQ